MRQAYELMERVYSVGGQLSIQGGAVHVDAPRGAVTPELKKELKRAKPKLLELEYWDFRRIRVASQENPGMDDIWIVGTRIDGEVGHTFWFVEQVDAK